MARDGQVMKTKRRRSRAPTKEPLIDWSKAKGVRLPNLKPSTQSISLRLPVQKSPKIVELKIVAIGNSRGVRLPKAIIEHYAIEDTIVLEVREEALVFRNKQDKRLSWEDNFKAMAREREDWSNFEGTVADGLDPAERW